MERLTDNTNYCSSWSDCEMAEGKCVFYGNCYDRKIYNKLREYEDLEEQGLLLKLPCPIGSTIYTHEYPTKIDADGVEWTVLDRKRRTVKPLKFALCHLDHIGDWYFLTKEEAEKALEEMEK